jgi:hypothetical protein
MRPSSRAMMWYFWRLSRIKIVCLAVLCIAATAIIKNVQGHHPVHPYAYANLVAQLFLFCCAGVCLFAQSTGSAFVTPLHLLTLPLATRRYINLFYAYLITVAVLLSGALAALHLYLFGSVILRGPHTVVLAFWQLPLSCVCLACLLQSLVHLSGLKNELRLVPPALAMVAMAFLAALPLLNPGINNAHYYWILAGFAIGFAWASSHLSIAAYRCGRYGESLASLIPAFDPSRGRTRDFASPGRALFWLAWRRHARSFPLWAVLFYLIGILFGCCAFLVSHGKHTFTGWYGEFGVMLLAMLSAPVLLSAAFLSNFLSYLRDREDLHTKGPGYFLTLPVRSVQIARGRLLARTLTLLLLFGVVMAMVPVINLTVPQQQQTFLPLAAYILLALLLVVWVVLWLGPVAVLFYVIPALVISLYRHFLGVNTFAVYYIFPALVFAYLLLPATVFIAANRRKVLDRTQVILLGLALIPGVCECAPLLRAHPDSAALMFSGWLLFPLPFAAVPLALDWWRHR